MAMQPAQAPVQPAAPPDLVTQLKELAALKEQGILTEEEFAVQKARILQA
jgi:Short C-terminal domain